MRSTTATCARLAVVRGAGDRELLVVEAEPVGGAALDQRHRLQHLDGRARKDRPLDVAERRPAAPSASTHRDRAAMRRLARAAAHRLDEDRIGRAVCSHGANVRRRSRRRARRAGDSVARAARRRQSSSMSATALALVLAAALLHALWNVVAKKTGGDARFALIAALLLVVVWAPLGVWAGWGVLPRWGARRVGGAAGERGRPRRLLHDPAARLSARRPHRRLSGRARHRAAARVARRARSGSASA